MEGALPFLAQLWRLAVTLMLGFPTCEMGTVAQVMCTELSRPQGLSQSLNMLCLMQLS